MTTTVIVKANHGWPVDVTGKDPKTGNQVQHVRRVDAGAEQTFYVHDGMDLLVHEVQPSEQPVTPILDNAEA